MSRTSVSTSGKPLHTSSLQTQCGLQVTVRYNDDVQVVPIDSTYSVRDLKVMLASMFLVPPANQRLTLHKVTLEDKDMLTDFTIKQGDVIVLDAVTPLREVRLMCTADYVTDKLCTERLMLCRL